MKNLKIDITFTEGKGKSKKETTQTFDLEIVKHEKLQNLSKELFYKEVQAYVAKELSNKLIGQDYTGDVLPFKMKTEINLDFMYVLKELRIPISDILSRTQFDEIKNIYINIDKGIRNMKLGLSEMDEFETMYTQIGNVVIYKDKVVPLLMKNQDFNQENIKKVKEKLTK